MFSKDQSRCSGREEHLQNYKEESRYPLQGFEEVHVCQNSQFGLKRAWDWSSVTDPACVILCPCIRYKDQQVWQLFFRRFLEGYLPVTFLNGGQHLQSILQSIARRLRNMWSMTRLPRFEGRIFLYSLSSVNTCIVTNKLSCARA